MSKNLLQDIVKIKHINHEIQKNVHLEPFRHEADLSLQVKSPARNATHFASSGQGKDRPRYTLWFVAIISIVFFLFAFSHLFLKVVVTVNPKIKDVVLNENLSASKGTNIDVLSFDLIAISGEENKIIQTTEKKDVLEKAQGIVVIYNTFSSATQRLDIDTRLEGSNGKIYKTVKQIVVPGMKGNVPGSIEVGIYAGNAGAEYNSGPLDFTIFGFRGTPKYSKFYARSESEIAGGFKGKVSIISDAEKLTAIADLKTTLQARLFKKVTDQIPNGFVLFKDAVFFNINDNNINFASSGNNMLPIKLKGTLYGLLFDEAKLAKKIAEDKIPEYDGSSVYISNIKDLTFSLSNSNKDSILFVDVENINFNLKGVAKIVWKLDENKLITDLFGKSKKDFNQILAQYPNIDSAELSISPFWRMSLPDKAKDIKVIVNYPK